MNIVSFEPSFLKIASFNANNIKGKKPEILVFLETYEIDVFLIQETWFKGNRFSMPNYNIFRDDRQNRPGGGTMILVKKHIIANKIDNPDDHIEGTFVRIKLKQHFMVLGSVYCGPHDNNLITSQNLQNIFELDDVVLLGGDLNAKHRNWGCRVSNRRGIAINNSFQQLNFSIFAPTEPTHCGLYGIPEILDVFLGKNTDRMTVPAPIYELSSDHIPVYVEYGDPLTAGHGFKTKTYNNWQRYMEIMESFEPLPPITGSQDLENSVLKFTENVHLALAQSSVTKVSRFSRYGNISITLKDKIKAKNRLKNLAYRTADPAIKRHVNQLTDEIRNELKNILSSEWENRTRNLKIEDNSLYHMTRVLTRGRRQTLPTLKVDNIQINSSAQKAELFAENFENQFSENPTLDPDKEARVNRTIFIYRNMNFLPDNVPRINIDLIKNIAQGVCVKKAPGLDNIPNISLKKLPDKSFSDLVKICQSIFDLGHFPNSWKKAKIILIKKCNQQASSINGYRPISLLSNISKICERVILFYLNDFLATNHVLPDEQFGFRAQLGTINQTTRLATNILRGFNRRMHTGAIFLDVSKAFDRVWHNALLLKLIRIGAPTYLTKIIGAFLSFRNFTVFVDGHFSSVKPIRSGVPQGSPLSPVLFNIFLHDFPKFRLTSLYLYADDTAITAMSKRPRIILSRLQTHLDKIVKWMQDWKVKINAEKTQAIFFTKSIHAAPDRAILINNIPVVWSLNVKYLGVIFNKRLNWCHEINHLIQKANRQIQAIMPLINKRSKLNIHTKILLYKTFVRSVITYGAPTWGTCPKYYLNRLQIIQNRCFRIAVDSPWFVRNSVIHRDLGETPLINFLDRLITKYFISSDNIPNELITSSHVAAPEGATYKLPRNWALLP